MNSSVLGFGLLIFGIYITLSYGCGPAEYELVSGECCPLCPIGTVVLSDCTSDSNTTCIPCPMGTHMSKPNALHRCFLCKICNKEEGLYDSLSCNTTSDTLCEILDGYHCKEYSGSECTFAMKHRQCDPGQNMKVPGNKDSDSVCEVCPLGYYSPLGINCTKWTDCSVKDEIVDREGSSTEDVQCKPKMRGKYGLIAAAVFLCFMVSLFTYQKLKHNIKRDQPANDGFQ
ncbi:hypothetical protein MHYP_G00326060 [Metynnis hypsauchen]